MKRFPRRRMSAVSLCVALGVVTSACVRPDAPTVGMSKVEATLVFGVTDIPEPVDSPIQQALAQVIASDGDAVAEEEQAFEFKKPAIPKFGTSTSKAKEACPEAPITAAPLVAPQPRISGDPRPGTSKFLVQGFITPVVFDEPMRQDFTLFFPRSIRNFTRTSEHRYSFEEVQDRDDRIVVTTYEVNNAPVTANPSDGVGVVATPGAGEPERGIVITKIEVVDEKTGQPVSEGSFDAAGPGLLVLPLPATAGEKFVSAAVDAKTGQVLRNEGTVTERRRVDACGDLVDGWGVEYTHRGFSEFGAEEFKSTKIFATQYGGVLIYEEFELTAEDCGPPCPLKFTAKLAQLEPTPPSDK